MYRKDDPLRPPIGIIEEEPPAVMFYRHVDHRVVANLHPTMSPKRELRAGDIVDMNAGDYIELLTPDRVRARLWYGNDGVYVKTVR